MSAVKEACLIAANAHYTGSININHDLDICCEHNEVTTIRTH